MVKGFSNMLMEIIIMENGLIIKNPEKGFLIMLIKIIMMDNG
jgi:hypothetical protein